MRLRSRGAALGALPRWCSGQFLLRLGLLLAVAAVVASAVLLHEKLDLKQVGYAAVGLTVLLASGGLVLPVPGLATACAAGAVLNPFYVALIAGSAGTLGELTGYFLGFSGRGVLDRSRLYHRVKGWTQRHGWLVLFLVALIPNPIFDLVGIAAGALRYPLWRFMAVVWVGKLSKFLILAYSCSYSIEWLTNLFGL